MLVGTCDHTEAEVISAYKRLVASRRKVKSGGRNGGRRPIPSPCPKCGVSCPSKRAARDHCRGVFGHSRVRGDARVPPDPPRTAS